MGVAGGLGGQSGGTGHTGVNLDDRVLEGLGIQSKLHVAAALDLQGGDDVQSGGAQHLELPVGQGLGGGHHDGVAGVDATGSIFSMEQIWMTLPAESRMTSNSISFQPEMHRSMSTWPTRERWMPRSQSPQGGLVVGDAAAGAPRV